MKQLTFAALAATVAALAATSIAAVPLGASVLRIDAPWSRETAPGAKVGAGYLRITNTGKTADRLVGGTAPDGTKVEIHTMTMAGGVMRMRPLPNGITIPASGTAELKPGANHLMFIGLKNPLKRGTVYTVTLRFEKAGAVPVRFAIGPAGAAGPGGAR